MKIVSTGRTLVLAALLTTTGLAADVVILRSGRRHYGAIVSQDRQFIFLRARGRTRRFRKSAVRRVRYGVNRPRTRPTPRPRPKPVARPKQATTTPVARPRPRQQRIGGGHRFELGVRLALLSGKHHSAFEERKRYDGEFIGNLNAAGSSVNVSPPWADNSARGAQLAVGFRWRMLLTEVSIERHKGTTPRAAFSLNTSLFAQASFGKATLKRTDRTGMIGGVYNGLPRLQIAALVGRRELKLNHKLAFASVGAGAASLFGSHRTEAPEVLLSGPVAGLRLEYRLWDRWRLRLGVTQSTIRGDRTLKITTLSTSQSTVASANATHQRVEERAAYRSRVYALEAAFNTSGAWWLFLGHSREQARMHYSQGRRLYVSVNGTEGMEPTAGVGFNLLYLPVNQQHKERTYFFRLGVERRFGWK